MRKELSIAAFEDIEEGTEGSVFMDNLTISSACRSLLGYEPHQFRDPVSGSHRRLFAATDRERHSSGDYDYSVNDGFRFAVDLWSLAQLVEAIIIFDRIFVDAEYVDRWGLIDRQEAANTVVLPPLLSPLANIIVPVELSYDRRVAFLAYATHQAWQYSDADAFKEFMQLLSASGIDGAVVRISDAYFETGFSDQLLSPPDQFAHRRGRKSVEEVRALIEEVLSAVDGEQKREQLERTLWNLELYVQVADLEYHSDDSDVLEKTISSWDGHAGRRHASRDIVRNIVAACFYSMMAYNCRMPYFPHLLRSPFAVFDVVVAKRGLTSTAKRIVESLERARKLRVDPINTFYGGTVIDIEIPALFSWVLQGADSTEDILKIAFEIRGSREAQTFRRWASEIDHKLAQGVLNIAEIERELTKIQGLIDQWAGTISDSKARQTVELSLGWGPLRIDWSLPWTTLPIRPFGRPHVLFVQRLSQVSDSTTRFTSLVKRVFGDQIAEFYHVHCDAMSMLENLRLTRDKDQE